MNASFDAHARPPESLRALFKKWQRHADLDDASLLDPASFESDDRVKLRVPSSKQIETLHTAFQAFTNRLDLPLPFLEAFELRALPGEDSCSGILSTS